VHQPVQDGVGMGVVGSAEHRHEHLGRIDLTSGGADDEHRRASWLSSSSDSSGQVSPRASALPSRFWMTPTLTLVLDLIWQIDSPAVCRNRRISRIFRMVVFVAGMFAPKKWEGIPNILKNNALERILVEREHRFREGEQ